VRIGHDGAPPESNGFDHSGRACGRGRKAPGHSWASTIIKKAVIKNAMSRIVLAASRIMARCDPRCIKQRGGRRMVASHSGVHCALQ
jgi:hypothetical protein